MAYINDVKSEVYIDNTVSVTVKMPVHEIDDVLICCLQQDVGSVTIATVTPGWVNIGGQVASGSSRQAIFWKLAASSSETAPTFTGRSETWSISTFSVKDVDTTTSIEGVTRLDWNATNSISAPSVVTTTDNCLIIYTIGWDGNNGTFPADSMGLRFISKGKILAGGGNGQVIGYKQQGLAGATPSVTFDHEVSTEGGNAFTIALRNKTGGARANDISQNLSHAMRFGKYDTPTSTDPSLLISTINGKNVLTNTLGTLTNSVFTLEPWKYTTAFTVNIAGSDEFIGRAFAMTSTDFTGVNSSIEFETSNPSANRLGEDGFVIALVDSIGNWVAYRLLPQSEFTANTTYTYHFSLGTTTPYDESGTSIDITSVTNVMILAHRVNAATNSQTVEFSNLTLKSSMIFIGGSEKDPCKPANLYDVTNQYGNYDQAANQGTGQALSRNGLQLGDGSTETYSDFSASSYELDLPSELNDLTVNTMPFIIYASATDTVKLESCIISTPLTQKFEVHASSNIAANYSFKGASIVGWDIKWKIGVTCNQANITDCNIDQNGGTFDQCNILNSPVTCDDLDEFTSCSFVSGGTGHAIELASLGGGSISWRSTDSGYAATDGSTGNETIYVNVASGNLTINVLSGSSTPTIRTAGAVVTLVVNPVTLKVIVADVNGNLITSLDANVIVEAAAGGGLAVGTDIIKGLTDINGEIENTQSYSVDQPVTGWVRKSSGSPYYKQSKISATIDKSNGLTLNILMVADE